MRYSFLLTLIIIPSFTQINAQNFELKGLEIYNPVYFNPAFTSSDKLIQTDALAYDFNIKNGYWLNVMSSLPKKNSSVGLSFGGQKRFKTYSLLEWDRSDENVSIREKNIGISYAYKHSFNEQRIKL